jgi:hypothetical protein
VVFQPARICKPEIREAGFSDFALKRSSPHDRLVPTGCIVALQREKGHVLWAPTLGIITCVSSTSTYT